MVGISVTAGSLVEYSDKDRKKRVGWDVHNGAHGRRCFFWMTPGNELRRSYHVRPAIETYGQLVDDTRSRKNLLRQESKSEERKGARRRRRVGREGALVNGMETGTPNNSKRDGHPRRWSYVRPCNVDVDKLSILANSSRSS